MSTDRAEEIKKQIAEIKKRWPAHSIPPAMMAQLDELDEALTEALSQRDAKQKNQAAGTSETEKPVSKSR